MKQLKIRSLNGRWVDKDEILLHAAFQLLQDYVEQEQPAHFIDWQHDRAHRHAWSEITSLYRWWTRDRVRRRSALDDKRLKRPRLSFKRVPGTNHSISVPYDKKKYAAYERALRKQMTLERHWDAEDQRNFHRLVEVRRHLWT